VKPASCLRFAAAIGVCIGLAPNAVAQDASSFPDFFSMNVGWVGIGNELGIPEEGPGPVTFDPEHPYISNEEAARTGQAANFRIADLTNPILAAGTREALRLQNEEALSGLPIFDGKVRCWPASGPVFLVYPGSPIAIMQGRDSVLLMLEPDHQMRIVAMNRPHLENPKPSWHGDSVGHYEGDTLVVDTIGYNDRGFLDNYRTPHSTKLHMVERYRMVDDGNILEVELYIEDQDAFTVPWRATRRFRREIGRPFLERVCAENNETYFNLELPPMPTDDTPDF
jgi:hypothetical protein